MCGSSNENLTMISTTKLKQELSMQVEVHKYEKVILRHTFKQRSPNAYAEMLHIPHFVIRYISPHTDDSHLYRYFGKSYNRGRSPE